MLFDALVRRGPAIAGEPGESPPHDQRPRSPKIGLVLGGGAARGWAHIGIIRALQAAGIVPDIIVGTSIGAVVGGCHAAGVLDDLEGWCRGLTKRRMFSLLDFSFSGTGVISGGRLKTLLDNAIGRISIEDLPLSFLAVATEIGTGHEIWLSRGHLVTAMRASYALPGIFEPVRVGGRWLMDGALVNPIPVSAARALGARLVIAVNLHADIYGRGSVIPAQGSDDDDDGAAPAEDAAGLPSQPARMLLHRQLRQRSDGPPGIPTLMMDAFNITQDRIARARLAGDPPDAMILPKLGPIGLFEFHRAEEAIALGAAAAEKAIDSIRETTAALA